MRFTEEQAAAWQAKYGWLTGCNFVPSYAVNQIETWRKETYNAEIFDRELGMAEYLGYNTARVFLHYFCWKYDRDGFLARLEEYLDMAHKHGIYTMFVFYTGGFNSTPVWGPQPEPRRGIHNSQWVQSPGADYLGNPERYPELDGYILDVIGRFKDDERVLAWDLFNEPTTIRPGERLKDKREKALALVKRTFEVARSVNASQPLTVDCVFRGCGHSVVTHDLANPTGGVFNGNEFELMEQSPIAQYALAESDINTFHYYGPLQYVYDYIEGLQKYNRPILCTEWMARIIPEQTVFCMLPVFKKYNIGSYSFGLVSGRANFIHCEELYPKLNDKDEPDVWYHDIFRQDGTPFSPQEVECIRQVNGVI
jgi:hypothetical protein